ncbi:uncharacterized protein LOC114751686 [Neltuma alba]|uniref:uncharacterized protein LOC114751686 n=1 Tax=Neltuma alba TaxID=207710 RepID=UPI0010A39128|nr:uncharacterized protein LOC114751686 [Prosopis alba]
MDGIPKALMAPVAVDGVKIIDSSNGLLCFKIVDDVSSPLSLLLWNLATREIRQVPRSVNNFKCDCLCGFGFRRIVNDYKIVKLHVNKSQNVNGVEGYSLGSGSWKEVEFENLQGVSVTHGGEAVTANGVMYWLGISHMILSFDLAIEVFSLIAKPLLFISLLSTLSIFENKLALLFLSSAYFIELWVMEECTSGISRGKWKWTKTHSIGPFPRLLRPVTIWRNEVVWHDVVMPRLEAETGELTNILYVFDLTSEYHGLYETCTPGHEAVVSLSDLSTSEIKMSTTCRRSVGWKFGLSHKTKLRGSIESLYDVPFLVVTSSAQLEICMNILYFLGCVFEPSMYLGAMINGYNVTKNVL